MIRSATRRLVTAVGVLVVLTGCSTFTDDNVVARVGDVELTQSEFSERASAGFEQGSSGSDDGSLPARIDGQEARSVVEQFITLELIRRDLLDNGGQVPDSPPGTESLGAAEQANAEFGVVAEAWVEAQPEFDDSRVRANYDRQPTKSKIACAQHVLVETESEAQDVLTRLEVGEPFADIAATVSLDTQSGQNGGSLGCLSLAEFRTTFIPEFVDAALSLEPGTPTSPVKSEFGYHVIQITPFDELPEQDRLVARLVALSGWIDVSTDPRFGAWSFPRLTPLG